MVASGFIPWLLMTDNPSIQYQTLVNLLDLPEKDVQVEQSRQAIMQHGPVPAILAGQSVSGQWSGERSYYTPKYTSTHWSLMLLTELGVDGRDARFRQGVLYMLEATTVEMQQKMAAHATGLSCFWGNLLRYALHAGMYSDERVKKIIAYILTDLQDGPCQCEHNWGTACAWGCVRGLWGLAALPEEHLTLEIRHAIDRGVAFLLDSFHLVEADYPTPEKGKVSSLWFQLNFPLFYQADILFALRVLDELDLLGHPGAHPALSWLQGRRGKNGRWSGSSPFRSRTWRELGDRQETDRWVSLQAGRILQHAERLSAA